MGCDEVLWGEAWREEVGWGLSYRIAITCTALLEGTLPYLISLCIKEQSGDVTLQTQCIVILP